MTRKDYKKLAELCGRYDVSILFVHDLCLVLKEDNPRFEKERFKEAVADAWNKYHGEKENSLIKVETTKDFDDWDLVGE